MIILLILMAPFRADAQSIEIEEINGKFSSLIQLKGQDQHGNLVKYAPPEESGLYVFFLPKAESKKEAQQLLNRINEFSGGNESMAKNNINKILVVNPPFSGLIAKRLFRSKLKNKSYTAIQDFDGDIIKKVNIESHSIIFWLVSPQGEILYETFQPFDKKEVEKIKLLSNSITE